jgi:AcrR family transcriptional regulator
MGELETAKKTKLLRESELRDGVRKKRAGFMLEKAREMLKIDGFQALNLPLLAQVSGYSKPTVYNYFPNKEDLMVALAVESTSTRITYYERAITFDGRAREKIYGIHSLNTGVLQDDIQISLFIHIDKNIRIRATQEHQNRFMKNEERIIQIISGIIREAAENGDLRFPEEVDEYQLLFTLMSTDFGGYIMKGSDSPVMEKWFRKTKFMHGTFGRVVMDGMGWRPLSHEWNYHETLRRFYKEVFPELSTGSRIVENLA